ncbi:sensor domain-containing diguanylate cyclase [Agrobacterium larrymoorei]|uniref:Sensor domain-containing diguanylate cyclase n=1 Tax=Agrobacterium larrymoorei TaxID=160699 RepID=A0A4D7DQY5_9HYPH|nr:sensor domain-containing diguanylate cyclase [Agrobacterium larrymoorei]QCI99131.1 sensor domain-containing diguanylate cyclase [Agrobacterium larrymoorei]QYA08546.1 sensor domain-containing diguanylate cyclase [Agrobacterium larrymoorei]
MGQMTRLSTSEARRLTAVREILPLADGPADELGALSTLAKEMFGTSRAAVHILDADWMHIVHQSGEQINECARDISACNIVVTNNETFVIPDLADDPHWRDMPYVNDSPNIRFYAGTPIELEPGLPIGAFCLTDTKPRSFGNDEQESLRRFATLAGALLRLQKANFVMSLAENELRDAAMTDPLTGFYNRKALDLVVDAQLYEALRENDTFGALYLDMDGFKAINDTLGHPAGDQVLQDAAKRIRESVRSQDTVIRMGGDEFAIFIPRPRAPETLEKIAERLLEAFRQPFDVSGTSVTANLSIGGAIAPQSGNDRNSLLRNVDEALYQAKKAGRNRFISRAL